MDYPAKKKITTDPKAARPEEACTILKLSLPDTEVRLSKGYEIVINRGPEKPTVHYYPIIARWRVVGSPDRHYGSVHELIAWLKAK